jgi:hypothetical protein
LSEEELRALARAAADGSEIDLTPTLEAVAE